MFACPSFPFDKVVYDFVGFLASASLDSAGSRVQDFFDLEFFLVIDEVRWWWRQYFLIRKSQQGVRGQELLVEAQVNLPMRWELQLVGGSSCLVEDLEGPDALVIKLLLGSWKVEVGSVQPDLVADLVVTHRSLFLVILSFPVVGGLLEGIASLFVDLRHGRGKFCHCGVHEW